MKTLVSTVAVIVFVIVMGTAVMAADYVCMASKSGDQWTYTVQNNHATYDVVEWHLSWNNDDGLNAPIAADNFTRDDASYLSIPLKWFRTDDQTEPRWYTDDLVMGGAPILHASGVAGQKAFTIVYKSPSSTPAPLFKVARMQGTSWIGWTEAMSVGGDVIIPEPGTIAVMLSGLAGSGLLFRRKRS